MHLFESKYDIAGLLARLHLNLQQWMTGTLRTELYSLYLFARSLGAGDFIRSYRDRMATITYLDR